MDDVCNTTEVLLGFMIENELPPTVFVVIVEYTNVEVVRIEILVVASCVSEIDDRRLFGYVL